MKPSLRIVVCWLLVLILPGQALAGMAILHGRLAGTDHHLADPATVGLRAADHLAAATGDCRHPRATGASHHAPDSADGAEPAAACTACALCCLMLIPGRLLIPPDPAVQHRLFAPDDVFQSTAPRVLERPPRPHVCA